MKIVALVLRHELTILIGQAPRKSRDGRSHEIAVTRTRSNKMRKSLNRTPRAPSLGALRLFEKFEGCQPPSPKRRLSASRRVAKTNVQTKVSRSPIVGEFANASSLYLAKNHLLVSCAQFPGCR